MAKRDGKPQVILFLEKYKIVIDLFGAIAAAVALLALYLSGLSVRAANRSLEIAAEAKDLQAAELQPVFQVYFKRKWGGPEPPVYSNIRAISPSGTFLDATAELQEFLVVGYVNGFVAEGWSPPEKDLVIIPTSSFGSGVNATSDERGTLIEAWDGSSDIWPALHQWWAENNQDAGRYSASVDFVAVVKISYLDVLRHQQANYYKIGGAELNSLTPLSLSPLRAAGRAPTLDPEIGQRCLDFGKDMSKKYQFLANATNEKLKPLYTEIRAGPNKDLGQVCGG